MARRFDRVDDTLSVDSSPLSSDYPFTMACWFRAEDITNEHTLMWIGDKDATNIWHSLKASGTVASDPVRYACRNATSQVFAATTTGYSASTWTHACAVGASATDRRVFINGGSKGTEATNKTPGGLDRIRISGNGDSTPDEFTGGRIAEAAVWNVALTDAEVAALAKGVNPTRIRRGSLVFYAPLWGTSSPERDYTNGQRHLTLTGATVEPHAPVQPYTQFGGWAPISAAGASPQTINPSGIASAEAFGTPRLDYTINPSAIGSAEAFGTPRLDYVISPTGIASAEAFGAPTLSQTNDVFPASIPSEEAFGTPRLDQFVSPVGIASAEAFGGISHIDQEVRPASIPSAEAFGSPTITGGDTGAGVITALPLTGVGR